MRGAKLFFFGILYAIPVNRATVFTYENGQYCRDATPAIEATSSASLPWTGTLPTAILIFSAERCAVG
jgi:hypothetical protein